MPLGWEQRKKLSRLGAVVDQIAQLPDAGAGGQQDDREAIVDYLDGLGAEIAGSFSEGGDLAGEFERLFGSGRTLPPQTRAAALAGWLGDVLSADENEVAQAQADSLLPPAASRKVSIGFKVRSPIVRDATDEHPVPGR